MGYSNKHTRQRIKWFSLVRITGLCLVLTYHFFQQEFTGGFIGVDVFFAFSGFLITSLMVDEAARTKAFHLLAFYRRRFYRIVPPLVLAVLIVVPLTMLATPDLVTGLGKQMAAALGFTTNYFEIATGGSYETKFIPHLFVHTWSLAVEMHFYLLWGLVSWLLGCVFLHFGRDEYRRVQRYRWALGIVALGLALASYAAMSMRAQGLHEFSPVYFDSITHSFPFYFGAVVGTLSGLNQLSQPMVWLHEHGAAWQSVLVMLASAAGLVWLGLRLKFDSLGTYTFGMLAAVGLACVMIVAARVLHEQTAGVSEPKIVTFLADTSYSMYLYHWPLYVIFSRLMGNVQAVLLTIALGLVLSALSYYVIEPLVAGHPVPALAWAGKPWHVGVPLFAVALGLAVVCAQRVQAAPSMSKLEHTLWLGDLYQDRDQADANGKLALAALAPKPKKPVAPKPAAPVAPTDYRQHNRKSTAAKHGIPEGASIIGDSVTLGTRRYLQPHVPASTVDAQGNRTMDLAYKVMMAQQNANQLREFVVICIGTNALDDYAEQLAKLMKDLAPGHKLVLMTPYNAKAAPDWNSSKLGVLERKLPAQYDWVTVADWEKVAAAHPEVFAGTDGVHFAGRAAGDKIYADTVNAGLREAAKRPAKS